MKKSSIVALRYCGLERMEVVAEALRFVQSRSWHNNVHAQCSGMYIDHHTYIWARLL